MNNIKSLGLKSDMMIIDEFSFTIDLDGIKEFEDSILLGDSEIDPIGICLNVPELSGTLLLTDEDFEKVKDATDKLTKKIQELLTRVAMATRECINEIRTKFQLISELLSDLYSTYDMSEPEKAPYKFDMVRKLNNKYNYIPNFKRNMPYHRRFYVAR